MRNAALGMLAGIVTAASVGWVCTSYADPLRTDERAHRATGEGLLALTTNVDERRQQITLIDSQMRTMVVYHIDKPSGEVTLRSVRSIHWDLQMDEFNGKNPLPREIRSLLEHR